MARRVFLVYEDREVLDSLKGYLLGLYTINVSDSGIRALETLREGLRPDIVVCDVQMSTMDGLTFLRTVHQDLPECVNIALTSGSRPEITLEAINSCFIFRILSKNPTKEELIAAIEASLKHGDDLASRREMLEKTLSGAVRALIDVLALSNPDALNHARAVRDRAKTVAYVLEIEDIKTIELAAMLSRIGSIILPSSLLHKVRYEEPITDFEKHLVSRVSVLGAELIGHLPRMERIADIIRNVSETHASLRESDLYQNNRDIYQASQIIKILNDLADVETHGFALNRAFFVLRYRKDLYDPDILYSIEEILYTNKQLQPKHALRLEDLRPHMVLASSIVSRNGSKLVSSGSELSEALLESLRSFEPISGIREPIYVYINQHEHVS